MLLEIEYYSSKTSAFRSMIDPESRVIIEKIAKKQTRGTKILWEDAAQAACMKVWEAVQAGKFQGGSVEFQHWAATVAKYTIIDLVRKENKFSLISLDRNIPGTDVPLIDTVADRLDLMDAVERADLILRIRNIVLNLDRRFPKKKYLYLYQGLSQGKKTTQIAKEQGITQGTISKRKWELIKLIAEELGLLDIDNVKQQLKSQSAAKIRPRSQEKW